MVVAALPFVVAGLLSWCRQGTVSTVVLLSAAAGFVHAAVTPGHFAEGRTVGLFTLAVTLGQMAVVVAGLNRPSRALWVWSAAGNTAVLAIWVLSRTVGVPVGPAPWTPEAVGFVDLACAAYEIVIVTACLTLATRRPSVRVSPAAALGLSGGSLFVPRPFGAR